MRPPSLPVRRTGPRFTVRNFFLRPPPNPPHPVTAKNSLESYCFNVKSTIEDDKLKDKISDKDRDSILTKVNETVAWLDANQLAEKDEYEHRQKELEKVCNPIISQIYAQAGNGGPQGPAGGFPGASQGGPQSAGSNSGPTIEEVD